jgi:hypothetical protein
MNDPKTVGFFLDRASMDDLTFDDVVLYLHYRVILVIFGFCIKKTDAVPDINPNSNSWLVNFIKNLKQHLKSATFSDLLRSSYLRRQESAERYFTRSGLGIIRTSLGQTLCIQPTERPQKVDSYKRSN